MVPGGAACTHVAQVYHILATRAKRRMAKHGTIAEFDRSQEDWVEYTERLEQYFIANEVVDASKKKAILLSVCGAATYKLIRSLVAPQKPTEKSYDELVEKLKVHYDPPPAIAVERFKFNSRMRQPSENVATYISELRQLAIKCNFGDKLDEMLRDRIVCGVNDNRIQRRLLAEPDLTFKKALEVAQALELADRGAADILGAPSHVATPASAVPIHSVQKGGKEGTSEACIRCGGKHLLTACKFPRDVECFVCSRKGHIARICRKAKAGEGKTRTRKGRPQTDKTGKPQKAHMLTAEVNTDDFRPHSFSRVRRQSLLW